MNVVIENDSDCVCQHESSSEKHQEERAIASYRMGIYRIISKAFLYEPTSDELRELVCLAKAGVGCSCRESEQEFLSAFASFETNDYDALRTQVASEYAELFVGPRPPLAPLYGSVYLDLHERLFTDTTMKVRARYETCGLQAKQRNHVPEDHIGLELEFLAWLCEEEIAALKDDNSALVKLILDEQRSFLSAFVAGWLHTFAIKIEDSQCSDYYTMWSRFADGFVREDMSYLETFSKNYS